MELALSLGGASKPFKFLDKSAPKLSTIDHHLVFCMGLSGVAGTAPSSELTDCGRRVNISSTADPQPSLQLALLPFSPIPRRPTTPAMKVLSPEPLRFPGSSPTQLVSLLISSFSTFFGLFRHFWEVRVFEIYSGDGEGIRGGKLGPTEEVKKGEATGVGACAELQFCGVEEFEKVRKRRRRIGKGDGIGNRGVVVVEWETPSSEAVGGGGRR
ncbi:hypothetical protein LINPERHAP2_LOCUS15606 [Linum perenne]